MTYHDTGNVFGHDKETKAALNAKFGRFGVREPIINPLYAWTVRFHWRRVMFRLIAAIVGITIAVFIIGHAHSQTVLVNPVTLGHPQAGGNFNTAPPTLATCGTSPALTSGSTDAAGIITVGTSASNACTLTFAKTWTVAPVCLFQNLTTGAGANVYTCSATACVFSSALADSTTLAYHCMGLTGSN